MQKGSVPCSTIFRIFFDRLMNADGIVLGAPNYVDSVPAPMKALFDRMADAIHCQMLTGKFGCSVCTAGGAGRDRGFRVHEQGTRNAWRERRRRDWCCNRAGPAALGKAETDARGLGKTLVRSIKGEITYPEQDEIHRQKRESFCQLVKSNKDKFAHEYRMVRADGLDEISKGERA